MNSVLVYLFIYYYSYYYHSDLLLLLQLLLLLLQYTKGGKTSNYIPRRGYPGTLAPGEEFKENNPLETLPQYILHPWPSLQEVQYHARMPVTHPMIPPPVLWFGMNNM